LKSLHTLAASALAVSLLAWFLRDADVSAILLQMRSADAGLLLWGTVLFVPIMAIRAIRWQYLMRPIGPVGFWNAWRTTMIGFAASNVLPARVGEVLRPYLLARAEGLNTTSTFATIVLERLLDGLAVLLLLALYLSGVMGPRLGSPLVATIAASAGLMAVAIVVLLMVTAGLSAQPEGVGRFVQRTERLLPARLAGVLARLAETFSQGLGVARAPRLLAVSLVWTLGLWLVISAQTWVVSLAFGIEIPGGGVFLQQTLLVIGIAVPTPGGVGGFHEAYRIGATTFFGASNEAAVSAALVLHALSFVPTTAIGGILMVRGGLSMGRLRRMAAGDASADKEMAVVP
jgi:uncharacterized protein (TIRG00374 family)